MSILCPQLKVLLLAMRMHVGARLECFCTIRTSVQIDTGMRGHVFLWGKWPDTLKKQLQYNIRDQLTLSPIGFLNDFSQIVHLCFASLCTYRMCIPRACRFGVCLLHIEHRTSVSVCRIKCNRRPRSFFNLLPVTKWETIWNNLKKKNRCIFTMLHKCCTAISVVPFPCGRANAAGKRVCS